MERTTLQSPHRSIFSDGSGAGVDIATPHHPYYSGSGAGTGLRGRVDVDTTLTGVYLSTVRGGSGYNPSPPDNGSIKYDLRCKVHSKTFISYCHLILDLLVISKGQTFLNYKEQIEQLKWYERDHRN